MNFFQNEETIQALNAIGENLFVTDSSFNIVWINDYADRLIEKISAFIHISSKEQLIGMNMNAFHQKNPKKQELILQNGPFPYETTIDLFNRYSADIVVNPLDIKGERIGYILTWKDVTEYTEQILKERHLLEELYTPVIDTTIDGALLLPIIGSLTVDRIDKMKDKVMRECSFRSADYIIFDFTGMTDLVDEYVISELESLSLSLSLLGVEVIFCGLSVELVQKIVKLKINFQFLTFQNYKQSIAYIQNKK